MNIILCSNAYPPNFVGGAELIAHEQAKALACLGHKVCVFAAEITHKKNEQYQIIEFIHEDIKVYKILLTEKDYSPEFINFINRPSESFFLKLLSSFNPDLVYFHNIIGLSLKLPILAKEYGATTICTLHDFWGFCLRNTLQRPNGELCSNTSKCSNCLEDMYGAKKKFPNLNFRKNFIDFSLFHIDHFISPSSFLKKLYIENGFPKEKISVLKNGINDIFLFKKTNNSSRITITFTGYLGHHKAPLLALQALKKIQCYNKFHFQVIGKGPDEKLLLEYIKTHHMEDRVSLLGHIPSEKMPLIYRNTDLFILPSTWYENQPVSIMEAMASSCAIIASDTGGIPEIIHNGINGLLFKVGSVEDLKNKIETLIQNKKMRNEFSRESFLAASRMTHKKQIYTFIRIVNREGIKNRRINYKKKSFLLSNKIEITCSLNKKIIIPKKWLRKTKLLFSNNSYSE